MDTVIKDLCMNWKFHFGECEEAWFKGFDDRSWECVYLPHDWSVKQPFSKEYSSGTGYLCGGIGWYRLHFSIPEEYRGKSIRIVFDGVYKNSQVWCNSYYLGKRPNGYISFSYDLTPFLNYGQEENEISVKVTHTDLADSRWFTGSGITRKVQLVIEEPVHPVEYGVFLKTIQADKKQAEIMVEHEAANTTGHDAKLAVETVLLDKDQKRIAGKKIEMHVKAGESKKTSVTDTLTDPKLWSPENPYLYTLKVYYALDGNSPYLVWQEQVGIRTIQFDPDNGFFLNGEEMKIKGVCVHHDAGCLGAAVRPEIWERRLEQLKGCGCNAIRCSHNPHMPELYELCDEMGFLVMDEAFDEWENAKNKWSTGHNVYPPKHQGYFEDFPQWHEADLRAMVRRDRNHPSVILWSIGNEIDYPNDPYCHPRFQTMTGNNDADKPAEERKYNPDRPNAERLPVLATHLAEIVRRSDTSRPVTLAAAFPELSSYLGFFEPLDVVGYNYKEHLYETDHKRFPNKPLLGSENGHSYAAWLAVKNNSYISGQFLWTGIDYLGEAKGWPVRGSGAGIITCAGFAKPEYYRRKSFWSQKPMLHIASRNAKGVLIDSWNYEEGELVTVECYSNLPQVALSLNGRELGRAKEYTAEGVYLFQVPYEAGCLEATAYDDNESPCLTDTLRTVEKAECVICSLWQENETKREAARTNREKQGYLYQIEIRLCDRAGSLAASDDRMIELQVSGAGELAGLESGNLSDCTPYYESRRQTCAGRLIGYVRRTGDGAIKVQITADMEGKNSCILEME